MFTCRILKGNLAPGGAVAKITGKEGLEFTGKARTFDTEDAFVEAVEKGEIKKGEKTVAVLRYLGPKGGPGESISHDLSFSTSRLLLAWELELEIRRSLGECDTNVSLRSIPFPNSLARSAVSSPSLSFPLFSLSFFHSPYRVARRHLRRLFFFLHLAEGHECGLASVDGALGCWFCFGTITV